MPSLKLEIAIEHWPLARTFRIARGTKNEAVVVVATLSDDTYCGRGECVPYARYGETATNVKQTLLESAHHISNGVSVPETLQQMPPGAARNALDCALWDLKAKQQQTSIAQLASLPPLTPCITAFTISLDTPDKMAAAARNNQSFPLLKLKLGGDGDDDRLRAVRAAVPDTRIIADANESWTADNLASLLRAAHDNRIELIEQPLPAGDDNLLATIEHPVPICADESVHLSEDLPKLKELYDAVNIKLDKTGGLTSALEAVKTAKQLDLKIMVGCMVGTSLAMAPAMILAQHADWVDLDGPLLLKRDRQPGLKVDGASIFPPTPDLWG